MNKKTLKKIFLTFLIIALIGVSSFGIYYIYRRNNPKIIKDLPDPFLFEDGSRVSSVDDWRLRREEIKTQLLDVQYGTMPERPDALYISFNSSELRSDGSTYNHIIVTVIPSNVSSETNFNYNLHLYIPAGDGPFPAIIKVSPDGTGTQVPNNMTITQRGYIYACFIHTDLDPDTSGYDVEGPAQLAYPSYTWGSLAIWAWGAMRVADFLLNEPWVILAEGVPLVNLDSDKIIVTGHSRRGKTALIAGAYDERFAMVVPNGSGCGGAGSFLVQGYMAETLDSITSSARFKSWFHEDFGRFGGREKDLEFDQHFLRSLVAPRFIISTDAKSDYWANPIGTQAIYEASQPVFDFLNASKHNAIHFRKGGHGFIEEDFSVLLDFSDKMLLGQEISGDFYMTPYDYDFPIKYTAPSSE